MTDDNAGGSGPDLKRALEVPDPSSRLQVAFMAGTHPAPDHVDVLVERSAVEPDPFVRDTIAWALTRHDPAVTVDRLIRELTSVFPQARSQALHTLSKIKDARAWPEITRQLLVDEDDDVARSAWRAAAALAPEDAVEDLAEVLGSQLGRGDHEVQLSLSRAFVTLGPRAAGVVHRACTHEETGVRTHAIFTARLMDHPEEGLAASMAYAERAAILRGAPVGDGPHPETAQAPEPHDEQA